MRCEICGTPLNKWETIIEQRERFPLCQKCKNGDDFPAEAEYIANQWEESRGQ